MMNELTTERLFLRKLRQDDAEQIFRCWASDDEVTRYLTWPTHQTVETTASILASWLPEYENDDCYRWGIELSDSATLIGMLDVVHWIDGAPEIGYVLGREYWNHGYMTEAFAAVIDYLFSEGFPEIRIRADERNIGSNAVIRKNGFTVLGTRSEVRSSMKPEPVTVNLYRRLRGE